MIIVGAGISGLSTGFYAQKNEFNTTIFEMHSIPGGLCTAWTRKGYTFDLSMHYLMNSKKGALKQLWDELGITKDQEFHYHKSLALIEGKGKRIDLCMDRKKLEEQMLSISKDDSVLIKEFLDMYFGKNPLITSFSIDAPELMGVSKKLKMALSLIPIIWRSRKHAKLSIQDYSMRFKDSFLSMVIRCFIDMPGWPMPKYPMMFLSGSADSTVIDSGHPVGGSKKVVFSMAKRFEDLGGEIKYKKRVKELIVENNKVAGIQLEDGSTHKADVVVWAADNHHLLFDVLKEKYMSKKIRKMYNEWIPVKPLVHVIFGVDMDLSNEPHQHVLEVEKLITVANKDFKWIQIMNHCFDKSTAPKGKSAIEIWYSTDYSYWEELIKDRKKYDAEKTRIANDTADALDKQWPGFKSKIEMTDVPTPMTYKRYTGNWQGSPDGWYLTTDNFRDQAMKRTLPGLKDFYMAGQWTAPYTGTVLTSLSGRQLIQILCKKYGQTFISN